MRQRSRCASLMRSEKEKPPGSNFQNTLTRSFTAMCGTIGFFAPDPRYASDVPNSLREFKVMVACFNEAGLEVLLDLVYNHTAEGNERGPTLSFKGIDN